MSIKIGEHYRQSPNHDSWEVISIAPPGPWQGLRVGLKNLTSGVEKILSSETIRYQYYLVGSEADDRVVADFKRNGYLKNTG